MNNDDETCPIGHIRPCAGCTWCEENIDPITWRERWAYEKPKPPSNQIAFQFPNVDIAPDLASVAREAARVLRSYGVTGPFTVTVTVEGHYPRCKDGKETR